MPNPFALGEIVPDASFVDRDVELDCLVTDLTGGQQVSSYSSYVAVLEGYARAVAPVETNRPRASSRSARS